MSDLRSEYGRLTALIDKMKAGEVVDTKEMLLLNSKVFSMLKKDLSKGSADASALFKEYLMLLLALSKKGFGEYTKEQKDVMEKAQEVIKSSGLDLSDL